MWQKLCKYTRRGLRGFPCILTSLPLLLPIEAGATAILYSLEDLPDDAAGDRVRFTYFVSERSFMMGERFSVLFDSELFAAIEAPAPDAGADWDTLVLQPDDRLPSAGRYEGIASVDAASLIDGFQIVAIFEGAGLPGEQRFEIFDAGFQVLESGSTVLVPEPAAGLLMALGLGALARLGRARGRAHARLV